MNNGRGIPYTLDGRTQCLKHWAREFNVPVNTVRERMARGHDLHTALTMARQGDGYCTAGGTHGVMAVWRAWITAPAPPPITD